MLAALLVLPANTTLDYSGLPQLSAPAAYDIRGHSATIKIDGETVTVESTTEYRYRGEAATGKILVPRLRVDAENPKPEPPTFAVEATWDKRPIQLGAAEVQPTSVDRPTSATKSYLSANVLLGKQATHALRLRMSMPLGRTGKAPQRRIAGYLLEGAVPIGVLNVSFQYGPPTVFNLPDVEPKLGWSVGTRGAFVRKTNYTPTGEVTTVAFWPGGF